MHTDANKQTSQLSAETPKRIRIAITRTARSSMDTLDISRWDSERTAREAEVHVTNIILNKQEITAGHTFNIYIPGTRVFANVVMNSPTTGVIRHFAKDREPGRFTTESEDYDQNKLWRNKR